MKQFNVKVKGVEVEVQKIVVFPVIFVAPGGQRRRMWQASVYSCVYDEPMYTTVPTLTASNATERAFIACIVPRERTDE